MSSIAWVDGALVPTDRPVAPAGSRGLLLGEGVFETCKVVDRTPFALGRHLARIRAAADRVGLTVPVDDATIRAACADVIEANPGGPPRRGGTGRLRITLTGGSAWPERDRDPARATLSILVGGGRAWPATATVTTRCGHVVNERSTIAGTKTTSHLEYVLAAAEAAVQGCDEAVLTNTLGALCEGTSSNLFCVVGGVLCTPSLATGCLPGVTRALVMELTGAKERDDLTPADLASSSESFLTSSTRDVQPIASVDGRPLPAAPGPVTTAAAAALAELQARTLDP